MKIAIDREKENKKRSSNLADIYGLSWLSFSQECIFATYGASKLQYFDSCSEPKITQLCDIGYPDSMDELNERKKTIKREKDHLLNIAKIWKKSL